MPINGTNPSVKLLLKPTKYPSHNEPRASWRQHDKESTARILRKLKENFSKAYPIFRPLK
jgi:hypothetical protein